MGQHKYNPTAIAAKNGDISPKPRKKSKKETEEELYNNMKKALNHVGIPTAENLYRSLINQKPYF